VAIRGFGEDANEPRYKHQRRPVRFTWSTWLFCYEDTGEYVFGKATVMPARLRAA